MRQFLALAACAAAVRLQSPPTPALASFSEAQRAATADAAVRLQSPPTPALASFSEAQRAATADAPQPFQKKLSCRLKENFAPGSMTEGQGCWLPHGKVKGDPCEDFQKKKGCDAPAFWGAGAEQAKSFLWLKANADHKKLKVTDKKLSPEGATSAAKHAQERTLTEHAKMSMDEDGERWKGRLWGNNIRYTWCEARKDEAEHPPCDAMLTDACKQKPGDWYDPSKTGKPFARCWSDCVKFDDLARYRLLDVKEITTPQAHCGNLGNLGFKEGEETFAPFFVTAEDEGKVDNGREVMVKKEHECGFFGSKHGRKGKLAKALCGLRAMNGPEAEQYKANPPPPPPAPKGAGADPQHEDGAHGDDSSDGHEDGHGSSAKSSGGLAASLGGHSAGALPATAGGALALALLWM